MPENGEKTTIGLISKKATLHVQHPFFVHFFAVGLHDHNIKLPETFLWRKCRTCSRSLFFHCHSFSPCIGGHQHFSFCHRRYKIFMVFFLKKMSPLFFISHSRSLLPFFSFASALQTRVVMQFPAKITSSCIWVSIPVD